MKVNKYLVLEPKENGASYDIVPFENDLKQIQELVGGYIDYYDIPELRERSISIWMNEEGKQKNLEPTLVLFNNNGQYLDYLCGSLVFAKDEEDETSGLDDEDIKLVLSWIKNLGACSDNNGNMKYAYRYKYDFLKAEEERIKDLIDTLKPDGVIAC